MLLLTYVNLLHTLFYRFAFQLSFARFYLPVYIPEAEKAVYLDDDVIVQGKRHHKGRYLPWADILQLLVTQKMCFPCTVSHINSICVITGDIQELYETNLKPGHAAAFSDDCDSASAKGIIRGAGNQVGISSMILFYSVI